MRTPRLRAVASIIALAGPNLGCGSSTDPVGALTLSATIDGNSWAPGGRGAETTAIIYQGDNTLAVSGDRVSTSPPHGENLRLVVLGVTGPGTYSLSGTDASRYAAYQVSQGLLGDPGFSIVTYFTTADPGGVVIITQLDPNTHTIQGTFNFTGQFGEQTALITEGSFSGRYVGMAGNGS
jgi:hypothetical protein